MKKLEPIYIVGIFLIIFQVVAFLCWLYEFGRIAFLEWYHIFAPTFCFVGYIFVMFILEIIWWRKQSDEMPRF